MYLNVLKYSKVYWILFGKGGSNTLYKHLVAGKFVKRCCQVVFLAKIQWSWHMTRLGTGGTFIGICRCLRRHCKNSPLIETEIRENEVLPLWRNAKPSKNVTFFGGVQHTFLSSYCSRTTIFARFQSNAMPNDNRMRVIKHAANARVQADRNKDWS